MRRALSLVALVAACGAPPQPAVYSAVATGDVVAAYLSLECADGLCDGCLAPLSSFAGLSPGAALSFDAPGTHYLAQGQHVMEGAEVASLSLYVGWWSSGAGALDVYGPDGWPLDQTGLDPLPQHTPCEDL